MMTRDMLYINGSWTASSGESALLVENPTSEEIIGSVPDGTIQDTDLAVKAAKNAFDSWSKSPIQERIKILNALSESFKERSEELAEIITCEVGTPIEYSRIAMVGTPRVVSKSYAKLLDSYEWEEEIRNSIIVKEPIGVCAFITPWNFPLHQIIGKVAPAIAAGCTMILKPSREAPINAFILADMLHEIGLPDGVFNLVSGRGSTVGSRLSSHPDVDMISFTGSTSAGIAVTEDAARTVKRVTLELGGKSANVVLEDADVIRAAKSSISACFANSGQTCSALTRLIVPESKISEMIPVIAERVSKYKIGNPMDPSTRCGPMVSASQKESVLEFIRAGIEEGATLVAGGPEDVGEIEKGHFVRPTVFKDVKPSMRIWKEEIFGPVLCIVSYKDEDEALELANDTEYGLSGGVWSSDPDRALQFARKMRTGQVSINGGPFNVSAPFGGYKKSGNGRELGVYGLEEFLEIKSIQRPIQ
ncbi:MAG: aldehyde dehydrogenase family protein [Candidatus Thermoplasmatota archaeon]|nr:aldehyde dehydrogenase family protein [Candidatus Thermoplasmatota archaeon]